MKNIILLILFIISLVNCGKYKKDGNVLILVNENIEAALKEFDHLFIKFFTPWCEHCKEMEQDWKDSADILIKKNV